MDTLYRIREGGYYSDMEAVGHNRNECIGLETFIPEGETVRVKTLEVYDVYHAVIKRGFGKLIIDTLIVTGLGGDNIVAMGNGNIEIGKLIVRDVTPTRPYGKIYRKGDETIEEALNRSGDQVYDSALLSFEKEGNQEIIRGAHVDAVIQMYATKGMSTELDDNGKISNIVIDSVDVEVTGDSTQAIMASEKCEYDGIHIGMNKYRVILDGYRYHASFNTLTNSTIGCDKGNEVNPGCQIRVKDAKKSGKPIKNNKYVNFKTSEVVGDRTMTTVELKPVENEKAAFARTRMVEVPVFTEIPQDLSIELWAHSRGVEAARIEAIVLTESKKKTHDKEGFPTLLYERHVMYRNLPDGITWNTTAYDNLIHPTPYPRGGYGRFKDQKDKFHMACEVSRDAAIQGCSWGFAQVLGENYEMCGFYSPEDFYQGMQTAAGQLYAFLNYLDNREGLVEALRGDDWRARTKRLYNGPVSYDLDKNGEDDYVEELTKHYTQIINRTAPRRNASVIKKSRTIKHIAADTVKEVGSVGIGGALIVLDQLNAGIAKGKEAIDKTKEAFEGAGDIVKVPVEIATEPSTWSNWFSVSNLGIAIIALVVVALYFKARSSSAYLEDNGYTEPKGDLSEFLTKPNRE